MSSVPPRVPINVELFVEPLHEKFKCPICLDLLNFPTQCPQGHVFCRECIGRVSSRSISGICKCPMDREEFGRHKLQPNLFVQNCIDELVIRCSNSTLGEECCTWSGPLFRYQKHENDECQFSLLPCRYDDCDVLVQRRNLNSHLSTCTLRPTTCQYCDTGVKLCDIADHEQTCEYAPAECPNGCGATGVIVKSHLLECPLELVECPLFQLNKCRICADTQQETTLDRGRVRRNALLSHACGFSSSSQVSTSLSASEIQAGMTHLAQTTLDLCAVITNMQSTLMSIQRSLNVLQSPGQPIPAPPSTFPQSSATSAAPQHFDRRSSSPPHHWRLSQRRTEAPLPPRSAFNLTPPNPSVGAAVRFATPAEEEEVADVRQATRRRRLNDGSALNEYSSPTDLLPSIAVGSASSGGTVRDEAGLFRGLTSLLQSTEQQYQPANAVSGGSNSGGTGSSGFSWQDNLMFSDSERMLMRRMSRDGSYNLGTSFRNFLLHRRRQGFSRYVGDVRRLRSDDPILTEFRAYLQSRRDDAANNVSTSTGSGSTFDNNTRRVSIGEYRGIPVRSISTSERRAALLERLSAHHNVALTNNEASMDRGAIISGLFGGPSSSSSSSSLSAVPAPPASTGTETMTSPIRSPPSLRTAFTLLRNHTSPQSGASRGSSSNDAATAAASTATVTSGIDSSDAFHLLMESLGGTHTEDRVPTPVPPSLRDSPLWSVMNDVTSPFVHGQEQQSTTQDTDDNDSDSDAPWV